MNEIINAAIIDDGVSKARCPFLAFAWVVSNDGLTVNSDTNSHTDFSSSSHAATCLRIIHKYSHNDNIAWHSIKILNPSTWRGNIQSFLRSLDFCLELDVKLIHLSMGSGYYGDFRAIESAVKRLTDKGIIIVAALNNKNTVSYPACLDRVIGVKHHPLLRGRAYSTLPKTLENIDFCASSCHEITENGETFITPIANSYAAPVVTAEVASMLKCDTSYEEVYERLVIKASKKENIDCYSTETDESECVCEELPVVAFVGFQMNKLIDITRYFEERFEKDEYYCKTALQMSDNIPGYCIKIPTDVPLNVSVEQVSRFFGCSILLLSLERTDCNCRDMYDCVDVWVVKDNDGISEFDIKTTGEHAVITVNDEINVSALYAEIVSLFENTKDGAYEKSTEKS